MARDRIVPVGVGSADTHRPVFADRRLAAQLERVLDTVDVRLQLWGRRFGAVADQVRATYGDHFRRAWELYLAGSQASFATGWLQLFQVVFAPVESTPPYWTREEMYRRDQRCCRP